jgi:thiol-disulfide isomerase/thioredoxin
LLQCFAVQAQDLPDQAQWSKVGRDQAADFSHLIDLDGQAYNIAAEGTLVLAHFWATWCAPCMEEFPKLDQLAVQLANRKVMVLAISEDRGGIEEVQNYLKKHPDLGHIKILIDQGRQTAKAMKITVVPTTVWLKDGIERERMVGSAQWDGADCAHLIP